MKISCQSCQAKYTIADEKVAGKTVKIKCKKCGATIVVHGNEAAAAPQGQGYQPQDAGAASPGMNDGGDEGEGATQVFGGQEGGGAPEEWTVNVTDEDQRTLTAAQIVLEFQRGVVTNDSYVWKDGMADWLPLSSVPELARLVGAPGPAAGAPAKVQVQVPAPVIAQAPEPANMGLGGTMMMDAGASPAAPAAARRSVNRPGVDLFATAERPKVDPNAQGPMMASAGGGGTSTTSADRLVGERNENSVLFSLSALTATENAARGKPKNDDAVLDMRPSPSASKNGGRAGMDDIMNLGGGGISGGPMLAPPPLLAPVVEPPPQAAPAMVAPVMSAMAPMAMMQPAPQKRSSLGLIIGIVAGLFVVGGAGAFFALRGSPATGPATGEQVTTASPTGATPTTTAAAPDTGAVVAAPPPVETTAPAPADKPTAAVADKPGPAAKPGDKPGPAAKPGDKPDKPADKPADKPVDKPADTPPADKPPADKPPADTSGGGKEFDRAAASSALSKAASAAKGCKKDDGPTGTGRVKVTFAPSGNVTSATVDGPPFAGTAVGGCVASAFRGAHVPPFDGAAISTGKSFTIN
jgi:predicted Zn finger-like uncharacterized protein